MAEAVKVMFSAGRAVRLSCGLGGGEFSINCESKGESYPFIHAPDSLAKG